jgi:uncharacterized protein (TIGR02217 family)
MSNSVFPTLPGLKWNQQKIPIFSTRIHRAFSGREYRASQYIYPLYQFDLSYEVLRDDTAHNELKQLMGFYLARAGAFDSFVYLDPTDSNVSNQAIATGNGANNFQMVRTYGNYAELIYDIIPNANNTPLIVYIDGNAQNAANYTIGYNDSGALTFNSAPANNANISATFSYYYRVRFVEMGEGGEGFSRFAQRLFELRQLSFITAR